MSTLKNAGYTADGGVMLFGGRADFTFDDAPKRLFDILENDFTALQACCYPFLTWHGPGEYDFDVFNKWVNWGVAHSKPVMTHMLAGPNGYNNPWIYKNPDNTPRTWGFLELDEMLHDFVKSIMTVNDNGKKVFDWNLVNELFDDETGVYIPSSNMFLSALGYEEDKSNLSSDHVVNRAHPVYIRKLFEYAAMYSDGLLEIRDYTIEHKDNQKFKALYQLVCHLLNSGARVGAVGFQSHMFWNKEDKPYGEEGFIRHVRELKKLGLKVFSTEADIGMFDDEELQAKRYADFVLLCRKANIDQLHIWGVGDGRDKGWRVDHAPLPYDNGLNPKRAYYAIHEALSKEL